MRGDGLMKAEKAEVRCCLWDYRSWSEGNPEKLEDVEEKQPVHTWFYSRKTNGGLLTSKSMA